MSLASEEHPPLPVTISACNLKRNPMSFTKQAPNVLNTDVEEKDEVLSQKAIEIARGMEFQMAMKSAIELGILDMISEANNRGIYISASEVAAKITSCVNPNAPAFIDCMLSLLVSFSVLKCESRCKEGGGGDERVYGVAPVCKYFLTNKVDGSMGPSFCMRYDKVTYEMWNHMNDAILEGGTAFEKAQGMKIFEYVKKNPRYNKLCNDAMSNYTTILMKKILDVYQGLDGIKVLVDVGGGIGASLKVITSKYPHIRGINFDLPHVVADAPNYPGVEHVGGDMFEKVPNGDAIFLKWILQNWNDSDCVKLLKNCWKALPKKGKVIVMAELLPLDPENNLESQVTLATNLIMYATFCAMARTIEEYKLLAFQSGFSDCHAICSAHSNWIIEFHKN